MKWKNSCCNNLSTTGRRVENWPSFGVNREQQRIVWGSWVRCQCLDGLHTSGNWRISSTRSIGTKRKTSSAPSRSLAVYQIQLEQTGENSKATLPLTAVTMVNCSKTQSVKPTSSRSSSKTESIVKTLPTSMACLVKSATWRLRTQRTLTSAPTMWTIWHVTLIFLEMK